VLKIEGRARGGEYVKRVVESYNEALLLMERDEYNSETVAPIKEKLRTVFNRDFWGGYYAAKKMVEHSQHYGSSATLKKVYMGKVTNYFKHIGVAEVLVEACEVSNGDALLFMGEKTGVVEQKADGIMVKELPVDGAKQGDYMSLKTVSEVRRGDKVYKEVAR
jgi:putative protease